MWATLVTGLPEVGLTEETARQLRGWYAYKLRSVLNQPAHVSRLPTTDLFELHGIRDSVKILDDRMQGRIRKLQLRVNRMPPQPSASPAGVMDITLHPDVLQSLDDIVQELRTLPELTEATQQATHFCSHCTAAFASDYGLRLHVAKMHRSTLTRYIPPIFQREVHAVEGLPRVYRSARLARRSSNNGKVCEIIYCQGLVPVPKDCGTLLRLPQGLLGLLGLSNGSCNNSANACRPRPARTWETSPRTRPLSCFKAAASFAAFGPWISKRSSPTSDKPTLRNGDECIARSKSCVRATRRNWSRGSPRAQGGPAKPPANPATQRQRSGTLSIQTHFGDIVHTGPHSVRDLPSMTDNRRDLDLAPTTTDEFTVRTFSNNSNSCYANAVVTALCVLHARGGSFAAAHAALQQSLENSQTAEPGCYLCAPEYTPELAL